MLLFLQMVAVNLIISCDNVGVIALAVRGLSKEKAALARRLGIALSFALKLLFIAVIGFLFEIPWLHIRIIGGFLLLYVTFNMLKPANAQSMELKEIKKETGPNDNNFIHIIISIVAADLSMSLDNVIAILSIVSKDSNDLNYKDILFIAAGLLICIPILLILSSTVTALMEKYYILTCICAGYLVYIAVNMIFEDTTLVFFFKKINFNFTTPIAVLFGLMTLLYEMFKKGTPFNISGKSFKKIFLLSFLVEIHAVMTLAGISYLSTNPFEDGMVYTLALVYNFTVNGTNTIFLLTRSYELIIICCAFYVGSLLKGNSHNFTYNYYKLYKRAYAAMAIFVLIQYLVLSVGLTIMFGMGDINIPVLLLSVFEYMLLLSTYLSIFCVFACLIRVRSTSIALGVLAFYTEHVLVAMCRFGSRYHLLSGFLPGFYLYKIPSEKMDLNFLFRICLITLITHFASAFAIHISDKSSFHM